QSRKASDRLSAAGGVRDRGTSVAPQHHLVHVDLAGIAMRRAGRGPPTDPGTSPRFHLPSLRRCRSAAQVPQPATRTSATLLAATAASERRMGAAVSAEVLPPFRDKIRV